MSTIMDTITSLKYEQKVYFSNVLETARTFAEGFLRQGKPDPLIGVIKPFSIIEIDTVIATLRTLRDTINDIECHNLYGTIFTFN